MQASVQAPVQLSVQASVLASGSAARRRAGQGLSTTFTHSSCFLLNIS